MVTPIAIDTRSTSNPADWNNTSPLMPRVSVPKKIGKHLHRSIKIDYLYNLEYNASFQGNCLMPQKRNIPSNRPSTLPNSLIHIDPLNDDMIRFDPS